MMKEELIFLEQALPLSKHSWDGAEALQAYIEFMKPKETDHPWIKEVKTYEAPIAFLLLKQLLEKEEQLLMKEKVTL
jgi:hypothetical protein